MRKLLSAAIIVAFITTLPASTCTPGQLQAIDQILVDLTGAICTPLEQATNNVYVDVACTLAPGIISAAGGLVVITDAGSTMASTAVTKPAQVVIVRVPQAQLTSFLATHSTKTSTKTSPAAK